MQTGGMGCVVMQYHRSKHRGLLESHLKT